MDIPMDSMKNLGLKPPIPVPLTQATQLELGIARSKEADRNAHLGGRSFYFFDFDDNVAFLATALVLFHKETGAELSITSGQYAVEHANIGTSGPFKDYEISWDDVTGTFRNFRDRHVEELKRLGLSNQAFLQDVAHALGFEDFNWKGPSWSCFYHATFNQRPVSVITARGHQPNTIVGGIDLFVQAGHLPQRPNFLSVYPVSNKDVRIELGDAAFKQSTAELKQSAIRASVEKAIQRYGENPHHRFGMSDDDPRNIQLIAEEMLRLKIKYEKMSFFLIETHKGDFVKHEITPNGMKDIRLSEREAKQYSLFTDLSPVK
jgi:hypothetical protein